MDPWAKRVGLEVDVELDLDRGLNTSRELVDPCGREWAS